MSGDHAIASLWRYPVKSMRGESCDAVRFDVRGIVGDRAYAIVDAATNRIASAKNPRLWPNLLTYAANYVEPPETSGNAARVEIRFPAGETFASDDRSLDGKLGAAFGRPVTLSSKPPTSGILEEYWPDIDGLSNRDVVTAERMPESTFFDCAPVHILSTRTLDSLARAYPQGVFDVGRFRPNVLVQIDAGDDYPEDAWLGQTLAIGDVRVRVSARAPRCVMTTLPHDGLPADTGILRTAARERDACVGIYAEVVRGGVVSLDSRVSVTS